MRADLDAAFAALADPTRRAIIARLAGQDDAAVLELAAPFDISLPAVSRHLKVLEEAGLIVRGRQGQSRPCRLRPEALVGIAQWIDHTRAVWEARFDRLEAHLAAMQRQESAPPAKTSSRNRKKEPRS